MKLLPMSNGRKWSLYGALVIAMGYAALTLDSQPAYAGTCTPAFCGNPVKQYCLGYCIQHGRQFGSAICLPNDPGHLACCCVGVMCVILPCP